MKYNKNIYSISSGNWIVFIRIAIILIIVLLIINININVLGFFVISFILFIFFLFTSSIGIIVNKESCSILRNFFFMPILNKKATYSYSDIKIVSCEANWVAKKFLVGVLVLPPITPFLFTKVFKIHLKTGEVVKIELTDIKWKKITKCTELINKQIKKYKYRKRAEPPDAS